MNETTFLLASTPTTAHKITIEEDTAVLWTETRFVLSASDMQMVIWLMQEVKKDKTQRHTFTDAEWVFDYDPRNGDLDKVHLMRRSTGRTITMTLSTAYKLLDALTGKTERLVKETQ